MGDRVGGTWPSRSKRRGRREIRRYLTEIGERHTERREVNGQRVAFRLPDRNVAIAFDPRSYFRLTNADGDPFVALAEHETPSHHLGQRPPFETPDRAARATSDPVRAAFETLGLAPNADRDRVQEVHPDRAAVGRRAPRSATYAAARNRAEE